MCMIIYRLPFAFRNVGQMGTFLFAMFIIVIQIVNWTDYSQTTMSCHCIIAQSAIPVKVLMVSSCTTDQHCQLCYSSDIL